MNSPPNLAAPCVSSSRKRVSSPPQSVLCPSVLGLTSLKHNEPTFFLGQRRRAVSSVPIPPREHVIQPESLVLICGPMAASTHRPQASPSPVAYVCPCRSQGTPSSSVCHMQALGKQCCCSLICIQFLSNVAGPSAHPMQKVAHEKLLREACILIQVSTMKRYTMNVYWEPII